MPRRPLGWRKIRARIGKLSDEQLREIELDKNTVRPDVIEVEAGRARLRQPAALLCQYGARWTQPPMGYLAAVTLRLA